jgi:inositol 3-alpha-galactosyltransferase
LITNESYLPGVIALAYSLSLHRTAYPLLVLVTPSLSTSCLEALKSEIVQNPLIQIHHVKLLEPTNQETNNQVPRFKDTWTKLRVFELITYDTIVYLDADTLIFQNPDPIFETHLPSPDHLAAIHDYTCTLRNSRTSCPYTLTSHPTAITHPSPVPPSSTSSRKIHDTALNSGVFIFRPSASLSRSLLHAFHTSTILSSYKAPDQDFLADFFRNRWVPLPWPYNALKPLRSWHAEVWRDEKVVVLHYVMDKPWSCRVGSDGLAGVKGRDGWAHQMWWDVWGRWTGEREREEELLRVVDGLVARELSGLEDKVVVLRNQAEGFPLRVNL